MIQIFNVVRYFDTYPDGIVSSHKTESEAIRRRDEMRSKNERYKVTYEVRSDNVPTDDEDYHNGTCEGI